MIAEFLFIALGLMLTAVLFYRFPVVPSIRENQGGFPSVSVIIPARNEEASLPLLLEDLKNQSINVAEIICVDDSSEDATASIASAFGARLISLGNKPDGWLGKSWACQNGAEAATGDLLLFLDADVRIGPDGLQRIMQTFIDTKDVVSVQPFHLTEEKYEQFSLFFNLVQIAANGVALPDPMNVGLSGPIVLIPKDKYFSIDGHRAIRMSIIEDIALGIRLRQAGIPFRLFMGDESLAFRMYAGGFNDLVQGWTKNLASGAVTTPALLFIMVFLWITSLASVPIHLISAIVVLDPLMIVANSMLYIIWVKIVWLLAKRVGRFQLWSFLLYPISLIVFLSVFVISMIKKVFKLKVRWKGRQIENVDRS